MKNKMSFLKNLTGRKNTDLKDKEVPQQEKEVFQQEKSKDVRPGAPFFIELLFYEQPSIPDRETMLAVMKKHIGKVDCFSYNKEMAGFAAQEYIARFQDGEAPVSLMVMKCSSFSETDIDPFLKSQMWDCREERDQILAECKYMVMATDMLGAALPALERAALDMDFLEALAELYPTCAAFYFENCGKLFRAADIRQHQIPREDRFIHFGVNARFFNIQDTEDMMVDTVGLSTLFLPDLQYHFHVMEPNWVVNHAYNLASYLLKNDNPIQPNETVDGIADGRMCQDIQWRCQYEDALIQPARQVIDICMGQYASGNRD